MQTDAAEDDGFVVVDWDYWKQVNPDIKAWITVDETAIDYPILQGPSQDPTFYLHHDAYGNYSVYGVPYFDCNCLAADSSVYNMIAFGHHMDNGSMFSDFASYSDEEYAREHSIVRLQTPTKKLLLKVTFIRVIDGNSNEKAIHFSNQEAFEKWYVEQREMADVVLEPEVIPSSIYTFCTCSYNRFNNERTLVVCYEDERI